MADVEIQANRGPFMWIAGLVGVALLIGSIVGAVMLWKYGQRLDQLQAAPNTTTTVNVTDPAQVAAEAVKKALETQADSMAQLRREMEAMRRAGSNVPPPATASKEELARTYADATWKDLQEQAPTSIRIDDQKFKDALAKKAEAARTQYEKQLANTFNQDELRQLLSLLDRERAVRTAVFNALQTAQLEAAAELRK